MKKKGTLATEDLEVQPPLSDSRLLLAPVGGAYVEDWQTPTEGMRYAVPVAVESKGRQAVEEWLAKERRNRNGERITRKRPEWLGEERSLVPITEDFRKLAATLVETFGGFRGAERAIESIIERLPAGRHRARYRVSRKQLERIVGGSARRFAQWRTLDALASIAPQIGVGTFQEWQAAIQSPFISLGLGLYRSWCISQSSDSLTLGLPPEATLLIQRYRKRWLRAGHESLRVSLAVRRALEPLALACHAGRGIECSLDELRRGGPFAVVQFVQHGLAREDILLRAQKGTARDRAEQLYGGPIGMHSWTVAARLTRREAKNQIENLQELIKYLNFVEERYVGPETSEPKHVR